MELRTTLEREKERADAGDARARDLQLIVQQARADNLDLEEELDRTLSILNESKPGMDALKEENAQLHGKASFIQNENSSLKRVGMMNMEQQVSKAVTVFKVRTDCLTVPLGIIVFKARADDLTVAASLTRYHS